MSVASALTDIANSLSTLLTQINAKLSVKGVSAGASDMAQVPDKINAIVVGSGIDTSDATAKKEDIRLGETAYANGTKLTGTLVPGVDTSDADAKASEILSGKTAYVKGTMVTGTLSTITKAKPEPSIDNQGNLTAYYTQSAGYVTAGTVTSETRQVPNRISATTYHPSTTSQILSAGSFLTGNQTFAPVRISGLSADVIKNGTTIKIGDPYDDDCVTSVTGTYGGGSSSGSIVVSGTVTATRSGGGGLTFSGLSAPSGKTLIGVIIYAYSYNESNTRLCSATLFSTSDGTTGTYFDFGSAGVLSNAYGVLSLSLNGNTGGIITANGISFDSEPYSIRGIYA